MLRSLALTISCCLLAACATTSPPRGAVRADGSVDTQKIDAEVQRVMTGANVPGVALAIVVNGKVSYLKAYGLRDREQNLPLETDTVMYAASLTKAMFAYTVMTLVDEGRIDLDRSIADYLAKPLPGYEKYADLAGDDRWRKLTPRILLNHTTGFANYRVFTPTGFDKDGKLKFWFDPGTRYAYSGEGINLLQFVLDNGTLDQGKGIDVDALINERVYRRFGMKNSAMTWRADFANNLAIGYDEAGKPLGHKQRGGVRAAGSMDTTPADYAAFLAGVQRGEGITARAKAELWRPQVRIDSKREFPSLAPETTDENRVIDLSYALGWGVYTSPRGGRIVFKEGSDDGWNNYAALDERRGVGLLIMANSSNAKGIMKYLADAVLGDTCMPWYWQGYKPFDRPELMTEEAVKDPHPPCGAVR